VLRGGGDVVVKEERKDSSLSEEKEAKRLYPLGWAVEPYGPREKKFFASFFQKRRTSFP
jgi:hypothetical protein